MSILSRVKIEETDDKRHRIYIDGVERSDVAEFDLHLCPGEIPTASMTFRSAQEIDMDAIVDYKFEPSTIEECIKFLRMHLQLNDEVREGWIASIKSSITESLNSGIVDNDAIANHILERLVG